MNLVFDAHELGQLQSCRPAHPPAGRYTHLFLASSKLITNTRTGTSGPTRVPAARKTSSTARASRHPATTESEPLVSISLAPRGRLTGSTLVSSIVCRFQADPTHGSSHPFPSAESRAQAYAISAHNLPVDTVRTEGT